VEGLTLHNYSLHPLITLTNACERGAAPRRTSDKFRYLNLHKNPTRVPFRDVPKIKTLVRIEPIKKLQVNRADSASINKNILWNRSCRRALHDSLKTIKVAVSTISIPEGFIDWNYRECITFVEYAKGSYCTGE